MSHAGSNRLLDENQESLVDCINRALIVFRSEAELQGFSSSSEDVLVFTQKAISVIPKDKETLTSIDYWGKKMTRLSVSENN